MIAEKSTGCISPLEWSLYPCFKYLALPSTGCVCKYQELLCWLILRIITDSGILLLLSRQCSFFYDCVAFVSFDALTQISTGDEDILSEVDSSFNPMLDVVGTFTPWQTRNAQKAKG